MEGQNRLPWTESDHKNKYNENKVMLPILVRVFPSLPKAQNLRLPFPLLKKKKKKKKINSSYRGIKN